MQHINLLIPAIFKVQQMQSFTIRYEYLSFIYMDYYDHVHYDREENELLNEMRVSVKWLLNETKHSPESFPLSPCSKDVEEKNFNMIFLKRIISRNLGIKTVKYFMTKILPRIYEQSVES